MNIYIDYNPNDLTELCHIMAKYGSDKSKLAHNGWHNYTTYYFNLFEDVRHLPLHIFELGLGTNNIKIPSNMGKDGKPGASLRGWKEFFPNSSIFGADIDKDILFNEERIKTYYCDQLNPYIINMMWNEPDLQNVLFDIIIEDGLHSFEANKCFFENSIHKLKIGGVYIIEDIQNKYLSQYYSLINNWKQILNIEIRIIHLNSDVNHHDNNIIVIQKK